MSTDEFIQKIGPAARRVCLAYNLPASVCIAQAAIESAWGRYVIGEYNFFGRKWNGIGPCKSLPTEEVDSNGNWYTITANFQLYDSLDAAIEDWCQLMRNDSNYEAAVEIWDKTLESYRVRQCYGKEICYRPRLCTESAVYNSCQ